jgi:hypothetical protein
MSWNMPLRSATGFASARSETLAQPVAHMSPSLEAV